MATTDYDRMRELEADRIRRDLTRLNESLETAKKDAALYQTKMNESTNKLTTVTKERDDYFMQLEGLKDLLASGKLEKERDLKEREKLEATFRTLSDGINKKEGELTTKQNEIRSLKEHGNRMENALNYA